MSFAAHHTAAVDRSVGVWPAHGDNGLVHLQSEPAGVEAAQSDVVSACERAAEIIAAALGRPSDRIRVSVVGHVNPDHAPCPGWADEFATVSVYVVPAAAEDTPSAA
jgi:hypothetical protein